MINETFYSHNLKCEVKQISKRSQKAQERQVSMQYAANLNG